MIKKAGLLLIAISLTLAGCATAPLPQDKRETASVESTTVSKAQGYNNLLIYLGKTLNDSNSAIKLKDPDQGIVVAKIGAECSNLRPTLDVLATFTVFYNVQVDFKDQKARISIEALDYMRTAAGKMQNRVIASSGEMDDIHPCVDKLKADLVAAINATGAKKADW